MARNTTELVTLIRQCADLSAYAWEMAIERAPGPPSRAITKRLATECASAYAAAIDEVSEQHNDALLRARSILHDAKQGEDEFGDSQHSRRAIEAITEAIDAE